MRAHTRKLHTEKSVIVNESHKKNDFVDWRTPFGDLIEKFSEAGAALKGFRLREGWTQAEVADKIGIDQPNLSKMENGKRVIGEKVARKLAKALNIDYRLLIDT